MAQPVITKLPVRVKYANQAGWWTPFCTDYEGSQYFAFVAPANSGNATMHNIGVIRRDLDGSTQLGYLRDRDGRFSEYIDDIGHNQPSITVDKDGNIYIATSMHGDLWRYFKSTRPRDVTSLVYAPEDLPDTIFNYTYPVLTTGSNGDVYMMVRGGASPNTFDRAGIIYRRSRERASWERLIIITNEENNSFYPDDLQVDKDNNVHVLWEWGPWMAGTLRHKGSYLVLSPDGGIRSISGRRMSTPVPVAADGDHVYQPLEPGEEFVPNNHAAIQTMAGIQTARLIYKAGEIHGVIYRRRPFRAESQSIFGGFNINIARYRAGNWVRETVFDLDLGDISTTPAVGSSVYGSEIRLYFSLLNTLTSPDESWLILARSAGTGWEFIKIGTALVGTLRFSVVPSDAGDLIYVTSPDMGTLYLYEVPAELTGVTVYPSAEALIVSL